MKRKNRRQSLEFWNNFKAPIVVAHRGGDAAGIEKENSLAAFEAAYKLGCRWFETDLVATRDRKLLLLHGRGFQLRPNKDVPPRSVIRHMTYLEVKRNIRIGGETIPLFEDLLDKFPDTKIFIEPKTFRSAAVLIEVLSKRPQDIHRICLGAFSKMRTLRAAYLIKKATGKEICTSILGPVNAYPIYLAARLKALRPFVEYYVQETQAASIHIPYRWITNSPKAGSKLIAYSHNLGLKVVVYTPNSKKAIKKSFEAGVDAVMSDRLALLNELSSLKA